MPRSRGPVTLSILGLSITLLAVVAEEPRQVGLVERAERRLAQIDVSVRGKPETIAALGPADFEVKVAGTRIESFRVDRVCSETESRSTEVVAAEPPSTPAPPLPPTPRVTFLIYFDQPFLTMGGRNQGLQIAREMIPELLVGGNRITVVSAGQSVTTYADLSSDRAELLRAIDAVEHDKAQWDPTAPQEESQIDDVLDWLRRRGADEAAAVARRYQTDERWRAEKALRRFSMVLGRLADVDAPKAVVYFADRMRSRPGEHYLSFFSAVQAGRSRALGSMETDAALGTLSFDRVVNEANAFGVRLYTVQAEGLTNLGSVTRSETPGASGTRHLTDAKNSLISLAHETGGEAFVNGVPTARIVETIRRDLSCVYVVSFDPAGLPEDRALALSVRALRDGVEATARGQIVIQSDSARTTSRLLASFTAPTALRGERGLIGAVVPTGHADGRFTTLVQVAVPGSVIAGSTWDFGVSVVSRGEVRADASGSVTVGNAGTPVVFEAPLAFGAGPYEVVMVAHDTSTDETWGGKLEGTLPDLDEGLATIGPISLLQPTAALFLRDGRTKTSGALGFPERQPVRVDRPTAAVTLVCRAKRQEGMLRVERTLAGDSAAAFPPMQLELGTDRCAQIRDMIAAGTMTAGEFHYEVRVLEGQAVVASSSRGFSAVGETGAAAAEPGGSP